MPSRGRISFFRALGNSKITTLLIVANILVYAVTGLLDTRGFKTLNHNSFLVHWGANVPPLTLSGESWRLFTSMFLHVGFVHLAMNMVALLSLGIVLEPRMRRPVFLTVYVLAGLTGSLVTALWNHDALLISCGASGAILGLFGAALVYGLRDRKAGRAYFPVRNLLVSLGLTFAAGAIFPVDNAAHVGGLAAGLLLSAVALLSENLRTPVRAMIMTFTALAAASALFYVTAQNQNKDLRRQIVTVRLHTVLALLGIEPDGRNHLDRVMDICIDRALRGLDQDGKLRLDRPDGVGKAEDLQQCRDAGGEESDTLHRVMLSRYAECRAALDAAHILAKTKDEQDGIDKVDKLCALQPNCMP